MNLNWPNKHKHTPEDRTLWVWLRDVEPTQQTGESEAPEHTWLITSTGMIQKLWLSDKRKVIENAEQELPLKKRLWGVRQRTITQHCTAPTRLGHTGGTVFLPSGSCSVVREQRWARLNPKSTTTLCSGDRPLSTMRKSWLEQSRLRSSQGGRMGVAPHPSVFTSSPMVAAKPYRAIPARWEMEPRKGWLWSTYHVKETWKLYPPCSEKDLKAMLIFLLCCCGVLCSAEQAVLRGRNEVWERREIWSLFKKSFLFIFPQFCWDIIDTEHYRCLSDLIYVFIAKWLPRQD